MQSKWSILFAIGLWGACLSGLLTRHFFLLPDETFFQNHENDSFLQRTIEFRDCLTSGYWFPQWCVHFRTGLGSPYFSYYQPGLFYVASFAMTFLSPVRAMGAALWLFSFAGYWGTWRIVGPRLGSLAGGVSGTVLLTSVYASTNLYIRGDLSEFAAMMLIPFCVSWLLDCEPTFDPKRSTGLAVSSALLVVTHPIMALLGYGFCVTLVVALSMRQRKIPWGALVGLAGGVGLSAFYWMPVFFEWDLVNPQRAFAGHYHFSQHFIEPLWIFGPAKTTTPIPVKVGFLSAGISLVAAVCIALRWQKFGEQERRLAIMALAGFVLSLFLMSRSSRLLWEQLPFLHRTQFPWRILATLSISISWLAGFLAHAFRPIINLGVAVGVSLAMTAMSWFVSEVQPTPLALPATAAEIMDNYFAPDIADEWLPQGAIPGKLDAKSRRVMSGPRVTAGPLTISQGVLSSEVAATGKSTFTLPHYYFPRGWVATINGEPVPLLGNSKGFMQIDIDQPITGTLKIQFTMTPSRRWGLVVAGFTAILFWSAATGRRFGRFPFFPHGPKSLHDEGKIGKSWDQSQHSKIFRRLRTKR